MIPAPDYPNMTDEELRTEFISKLTEMNYPREGMDKLVAYIKNKTDFFTAPASTKYHGAKQRGLLEHSLYVYHRLLDKFVDWQESLPDEKKMPLESYNRYLDTIAVVALLHDICKTNFYEVSFRNVKQQDGSWSKEPYFKVREDILAYGHGEESVYIIQSFIHLDREEAFAIRFHMGEFEKEPNTSRAFERYPLAVELHVADLEATYIDENRHSR